MIDFVAKMETYAREHVSVKHTDTEDHFFKVSGVYEMEELLANLPYAQYPAVVVHDNPMGSFADAVRSNNFLDSPHFTFYVLRNVDITNKGERSAAYTECKEIGRQILGRMRHERLQGDTDLKFIDFRSVPYQGVGPIGDNAYGVMFTLTIPQHDGLPYDETKWQTT